MLMQWSLVTEAKTSDFVDFLLAISLLEAKSSGMFYSWSNSSIGEDRFLSRIDKGLVHQAWLAMYAEVCIQYLTPRVSAHSPLHFNMSVENREGARPFRFLNVMAEHVMF